MPESKSFADGLSMDIERINAIGALLSDLSDRTEQLRGYL
jgi:CHASE3 domain sensor protein